MTIDVERFHQLFFEEALEHVGALEAGALKLDPAQPDPDLVNAIFRAAHSIKGGAATFGFERLTQMTHALETLLDQVRKNERAVTPQLVRLLLNANDVLRLQVLAQQQGDESDSELAQEVLAQLRAEAAAAGHAARGSGAGGGAQSAEPSAAPASSPAGHSADVVPAAVIVTLRLEDAERDAAAIERMQKDLSAFGETSVLTPLEELPSAESIRVRIACAKPVDDLRESLAFIWDEERFSIAAEEGQAPQEPQTQAQKLAQIEDDGLGFFAENLPEALAQEKAQEFEPAIGRRAYDYGPDAAKFGRRQADRFVAAPIDTSSIRIGVEKVDRLVNLVGELVIAQAMLSQSTARAGAQLGEDVAGNLGQLDRNIRELHEAVMAIRMLPVSYVFSRFPRVVRDLADKLQKKVELVLDGEETELDKGLIEKMTDPLTHLVRNSVDHGIESPEQREALGKPPIGTLRVRAAHEGGNVMIEVADDGAGFNRERLLAKAREHGVAGLSTAKEVTEVSGRGVGMDVVKRNLEQLGGRLELSSAAGQGTTVTIRLPLTLAILDGMLITVGNHTYVVPLTNILENQRPAADAVKSVTGQGQVVRVREEFIPLIVLHEVLNIEPERVHAHEAMLVICEADGKRAALQVDDLVGQGQFVIKSLEQNFRKIAGVAGATILGDGRVALILDVATLLRSGRERQEPLAEGARRAETVKSY
jgi:two-component system, chemotaxis family, sensor kinase CheA